MHIENIIIGTPIVSLDILLGSQLNVMENYLEVTVFDNERYLPKLLVKYGVAPSIKEIKRNRKELDKNLENLDCIDLKYGKSKLYIVVGM